MICESISLSQMTRQGNRYLRYFSSCNAMNLENQSNSLYFMSCLISSSFLFEQVEIGNTPSEIDAKGLESLAKGTKGFSGSDISSYVSVNFDIRCQYVS